MPLGGCRVELRCESEIIDPEKRPCELEIFDSEGQTAYSGWAGVELRGRSSLLYPKKNYAVELRTSAGDDNPENLLGMGREADWVLDGSWLDRSFMRNDLVFELFRDAGHYAPESRYCTLKLDDEERGIYRLGEKIKRDDDRLDIAADDGSGTSFVIKQEAGGGLYFDAGLEEHAWQFVYPRESAVTSQQREGVQRFLDELEDALEDCESGDDSALFSLLDLRSTVDFILVEEFSKNIDGFNLSLHLSRSAGGAAQLTPWDFDLSLGQPTLHDNPSNDTPEGWIHDRTRFIRALAASDTLRAELVARWRQLRAGPFATNRVLAKIDRFLAALGSEAIARNFEIWPIEEVDFSFIFPPYRLYDVSSHAEEVERLRSFVRARLAWMDDHIDEYPH